MFRYCGKWENPLKRPFGRGEVFLDFSAHHNRGRKDILSSLEQKLSLPLLWTV